MIGNYKRNWRIIVCVTLFAYSLYCCDYSASPRLVLSTYHYDLGRVKHGDVYSGNIYVYNRGKDVLKIERFSSDCSCTQLSINKKHILVNDSAVLKFTFDAKNKIGETASIIILEANTDSIVHYAEIHATVEK